MKFEDTNTLESVLVKETQKILWDVEIKTNHLIQTKGPDLMMINKKKQRNLI